MFIAVVNWKKCTNCGDCVKSCPVNCFQMTDGEIDPHRASFCIDCGECVEVCQDDAVAISIGWGGYSSSVRVHG